MSDPSSSNSLAPGAAYERALGYLFGRINYERNATASYRTAEFRLDRMRELARRLGDPHQRLRIIHVAGTKGKGSTAAMIASVLQQAGYRTGLYTSPHLERLEERLVINGQTCSPEQLVDLIDTLAPVVTELDASVRAPHRGPTFFEITTAMALVWFAREAVDLAVLEVGLGGRLDSTNICTPEVSVITSISYDHTKQLGNTLPEIAGEKAGIIKPGVPVVSGVVEPSAAATIKLVASQQQAPLHVLGEHFGFRRHAAIPGAPQGACIDYWRQQPPKELAGIQLGLLGEHQACNAAVALATLDRLAERGWKASEAATRSGLASVQCAARLQLVRRSPDVVLDVAHNVASIEALLKTLDECFIPRQRALLFAASHDKDVEGMLRRLLPRFDLVVLTRYCNNPRAVPPEVLSAMARQILDADPTAARPTVETASDPATGWGLVRRSAGPGDLIAVTGSFFLAGEVRPLLDTCPATAPAAEPIY